ncbi:GNAT family N-acetyltransferase [Bacillus licheniformis]|nr:GNAT family N-acetyltransferase [Bacillus licheniformis]
MFDPANDALIGTINLSKCCAVPCKAPSSAILDQKHNGKGYTTEAVKLMVEFAFHDLKLHRIEAGVMPRNIASIRVLEKAGFTKKASPGKRQDQRKWEDHQLLAVINPHD